MNKKNSDITKQVDEILVELHSIFHYISEKDISCSRVKFSEIKLLFIKINKLGKAGIINYLQGLDRENIAKSKEISLFFLFIIEKYSENEFAEILYSLYKDPNNNIPPYIEEIKPKKSTWRIINFLRALINRFKRKKFKIVDLFFKELYTKAAQENFKNLSEGNIQYVKFKEDNEELLSQLHSIIQEIFLIKKSQNQGETSLAAPLSSVSTELASTPQPLFSASIPPAPAPTPTPQPPPPASTPPPPPPASTPPPPPPLPPVSKRPTPQPLPPALTELPGPDKRPKAAGNSGSAVCDKISDPAPPKGLDMAELQKALLALREKKEREKINLEPDGSPEKNTLRERAEGDDSSSAIGAALLKRMKDFAISDSSSDNSYHSFSSNLGNRDEFSSDDWSPPPSPSDQEKRSLLKTSISSSQPTFFEENNAKKSVDEITNCKVKGTPPKGVR